MAQTRRRAVRRRALGRGAGHGGGCAAARGRPARQRGDLRRLLWLGERRSFPPFAEPAASLSQSARRLHLLRPVLLHGHGPGDHPPCARRRVLQAHERGADDRGRAGAYPPGGELRRHLDEEHADQPGRHRRPFRARPPRALARRRRRGGLHQPGTGRRRRFSRCRLVADPSQCRCRADAGSGAHAAQRGSARQGFPALPLRRLRALRPLSARPERWRAEGCRLGGGDLRHRGGPDPRACPPDGERALPPVDQLVAAADRERRSALLDDRGARRHARQSRPARPRRRLRLWLHPQFRLRRPSQPAVQGRSTAPGRQSGRDLHPRRAHRRHAARVPAARCRSTARP